MNTNRGFGLTGTDFVVLADMTDDATFLGEINLQTGRGGSSDLELDVERFFVNYRIDPRFNVQAGLFFTPIGYNNRFLYARAWLMNSIQVPDFFEEELNLFPTHSIGVAAHGEFAFNNGHRLAYVVSAANGRPHTPDSAVYARDYTDQQGNHRPGRVAHPRLQGQPRRRERLVRQHRLGARARGSARSWTAPRRGLRLSERGVDAYVVVNHRCFSINAEYVRVDADRSRSATSTAASTSRRAASSRWRSTSADGKLHPYVRFDRTSLPDDGGPYLSLRETDGGFTRVYVPESKAAMTGVAFDVNQHMRVKGEYIRHLAGPRERHGVAVQTGVRLLRRGRRPCFASISAPRSRALVSRQRRRRAGELVGDRQRRQPGGHARRQGGQVALPQDVAAWGNGEKVRPVDQAGDADGAAAFVAKVLGMSAADFERYWIEKQYASADNPPTKAPDDASVIKLVKAFKGGIGFVSKEAATAAGADVKVV